MIDGRYDLIRNATGGTSLYAATAVAESVIVDALDNDIYGITRVSVDLTPNVSSQPAGSALELYLSNNDGRTWELANANVLAETESHTFTSYGTDLRWRVVFESTLVDAPSGLDGGVLGSVSNIQPTLTEISLTTSYVGSARYSRSRLAAGQFDVDGDTVNEDVAIQASFSFPGWDGYLEALDITNVSLVGRQSVGPSLDRFDNDASTVSAWEAGNVSTSTPGAGSRTILAVDDPSNSTLADRTVAFTTANVSDLMGPMGIAVQADAETAITYVRNGMSDTDTGLRKHRDFGHSSPVLVGPPSDDSILSSLADPDDSRDYAGFVTDNASREPRVYIGSNDGMLRAFDATTGSEVWALIPPNLLPKIGSQRQVLSDGSVDYVHDFFVDGSVQVQELWDSSAGGLPKSRWKTVLIVGQALGQGGDMNNYYFAVDVTDPDTPLFLWEFTDDRSTLGTGACDRSDESLLCSTSCASSCSGYSCSTTAFCDPTEPYHLYSGRLGASITLEAEHYNENDPANGADPEFADNNWVLSTAIAGYREDGFMSTDTNDDEDRCDPTSGITSGVAGGVFLAAATTCAPYLTFNFRTDEETTFYPMIRYHAIDTNQGSIWYRVDSASPVSTQFDSTGFSTTDWFWHVGSAFTVDAGFIRLRSTCVKTGSRLTR